MNLAMPVTRLDITCKSMNVINYPCLNLRKTILIYGGIDGQFQYGRYYLVTVLNISSLIMAVIVYVFPMQPDPH